MSNYVARLNTDDELPGGTEETSDLDMDEDSLEDMPHLGHHTSMHQLRTILSDTGPPELQEFQLIDNNTFNRSPGQSETLRAAMRLFNQRVVQPVRAHTHTLKETHPKRCRLMCWVMTLAFAVGLAMLIMRYGGPEKLYPMADNPFPVASLVIRSRHPDQTRAVITVDQDSGVTRVDFSPWIIWLARNGTWTARRGLECFTSTERTQVAPLAPLVDLVLPAENEWFVEHERWIPQALLFSDPSPCLPGDVIETTVAATQPIYAPRADVLARLDEGWLLERDHPVPDYREEMAQNFSMGTSVDPMPWVVACEGDCTCLYTRAAALLEPFVNPCTMDSLALAAECWVTQALLYQTLLTVPCTTSIQCVKYSLILPLRLVPYCPGLGYLLACENQLAALPLSLETQCRVTYEHLEDYTPAFTLAAIPVTNKTLV